MICIVGNRPVLQVGRQQVTGYGTGWIRDGIIRGAKAASRDDFPFIDDLLKGILHYLENKCSLRVLTIEELHTRVRRMLERIGCEAIAQKLPLTAPPITISLYRAAREAGNGFELAFFNQLQSEIEDLKTHGVAELHFTDIRECVLYLKNLTRWTPACETLKNEIINYLGKFAKNGVVMEKNN